MRGDSGNGLVGKIAAIILIPSFAAAVGFGVLIQKGNGATTRLDILESKMDMRSETQAAILAQLEAINKRLDEMARRRAPGL